ncbi:MAG: GAF domain-containing protein, partial [Chloroflexota bacterium]
MPKKPTSNRLDKLFEDINEEVATPEIKQGKKPAGERKTAARAPKGGAKPVVRASALAQTTPLPPPAETPALTQAGSESTPATLSLGFQLDQRNWATLQVVDEQAVRVWDENEQTLVRQVTDQLSQALENARLFQETRSRAEELD